MAEDSPNTALEKPFLEGGTVTAAPSASCVAHLVAIHLWRVGTTMARAHTVALRLAWARTAAAAASWNLGILEPTSA